MRKALTSKVIAISNQKGGVGKSTITTLLANIFYFVFNLKIAIIDVDRPQYSIYKRHQLEAEAIHQKPALNKVVQELYEDSDPIMVYPTILKEANTLMKQIQEEYDLIFLDITGTLNQKGLDKVLSDVHHFFIPVLQDADSLRSSLEFYKMLQKDVLPISEVFESCHFFLNNLPAMNKGDRYRQAVHKEGGKMLKTAIRHYAIYERGFRSTLLPIPEADVCRRHEKEIRQLYRLAEEINLILQTNVLAKAPAAKEEVHVEEELLIENASNSY